MELHCYFNERKDADGPFLLIKDKRTDKTVVLMANSKPPEVTLQTLWRVWFNRFFNFGSLKKYYTADSDTYVLLEGPKLEETEERIVMDGTLTRISLCPLLNETERGGDQNNVETT